MIPTATLVWLILGAAFAFALPIGLLVWWRRTRRAKLLPFFVGAAVFVAFAVVLETLLHQVCVFGDNAVSRAINANPYLYMLYGALAAGVFEETGRYIAFRWIIGKRRYPERDTAVTYGVGHGGIEAVLVMGVTYAAYVAQLLNGTLDAGLMQSITPGAVLLAMLERGAAMILHIALSIFVFLAVRDKRQWTWFPFAVALHAIADMPAALYQRGLLPLSAVEIWVWVVALYALRSARKQYLEAMDP